MQQNNEETTSPQKGTIVTTPGDNTNAAQDSAVFNNNGDHESSSDDRPEHQPGFMPGPDYTGTGIFTGYTSDQDVHGNIEEGGVILEGFLPEDDPSRRRRRVMMHVPRVKENAYRDLSMLSRWMIRQ